MKVKRGEGIWHKHKITWPGGGFYRLLKLTGKATFPWQFLPPVHSSGSCFLMVFLLSKPFLIQVLTAFHLGTNIGVKKTQCTFSLAVDMTLSHRVFPFLCGGRWQVKARGKRLNCLRTRLLKSEKLTSTTLLWPNESSLHLSRLHPQRQECAQQVGNRKTDHLSLPNNSLYEL